jgi:hypothetical protein
MARLFIAVIILVVLAGIAFGLGACAASDNAAANRASAEASAARAAADVERARGEAAADQARAEAEADAEKKRAAAEAYQLQVQADVAAAAERSNIRQSERDAAHQRAMEILPYVALIVGALLLAGLGGLIFWDLRRNMAVPVHRTIDPRLLRILEQQQRQLADVERVSWHAIATAQRAMMAPGNRDVIIYRDGEPWKQ